MKTSHITWTAGPDGLGRIVTGIDRSGMEFTLRPRAVELLTSTKDGRTYVRLRAGGHVIIDLPHSEVDQAVFGPPLGEEDGA